ncbi:hypothetical protein ABEB36_005270 [Hypothenemus hampei]|uniref:Centrosomal protein of 135 kDa n=1 Tax=Hypothenemus hampei TaxID=57062 RepID=A0ABD1F062_HYPHA
MCNNFKEIREQLDELGYFQTVHPESIPLVQKLLLDLNQTTANLQKYMKISQQALEEKNLLELGAEPYKCDNAKLLRECNELHQAFIHFKEQHEKVQRDLRHQISNLQAQLENCNFEKLKLINSIQNYEKEKVKKGTSKTANKTKTSITRDSIQTNSNKKIKDLELKHLKLMDDNEYLKTQIKRRDEEIKRLQSLTEKGRSYETISKECCYKNIDIQMMSLQEEITRLKGEKTEMQLQLNDAVAKQHEAMRRALHLAERNRQLEQELKEVDEVALAVEAECNNTVKGNSEKVARLQDRINESLIIIQELEIENAKLKQTKLELTADLQAIELEKCNLRKELDKEKNDKKNLTDRINSFTVIENDLNLEIDRLTKLVANQRKRILELESLNSDEKSRAYLSNSNRENVESLQHMVNTGKSGSIQKVSSTRGSSSSKVKTSHKNLCKKSKNKTTTKNESATVEEETVQKPVNPEFITKCCCESGNCIKNLKDLLDREAELRKEHARQSIDDLRREKDYYMKEYHRILEQMRNVPNYEISENGLAQLKLQLNEKNNRIKRLEEELQYLNNEKSSLHVGDLHTQVPCNKMSCKSRDRELEIKTKELNHLEAENNTLKGKLQAFNETTIFNEERMKKAFKDMEEHIRKLEDERRDLVKTEVTQRSNISQLEDEYKNIKDQLKRTQIELNSQRANYNQLKLLHEQTDRALGEAQTQLLHAENELGSYKSRAKDSSRDTFIQDKEITKLSSDIQIMKNQLTKLDKEKDDLINKLDEKTERIAELEDALHTKDNLITKLENDLRDVNRKLSKYVNESSSQEHLARTKQQELTVLEQDYEKEKRLKEAALLENKRLQNDLSSVTYDCREARKELEITRRQVEDLKRQLQHYVAEVKRTEDLISQKELERSELLDQFRSLSQEANILETNNHTLETEATQSKIQLSVALDHTSELERKIENQESIIKSYEKQITDLTAHIARLEVQLKQNTLEQERCNAELKQMRDLCVKLDKDKDVLKSELNCNEDIRSQEQRLTQRLSEEKTSLQKILDHERSSRESLEKLLKDARVDLTEQRLLNQDLQREVNILKDKIEDLEERLTTTTEQLHTYEGKVLEYSQQNKQLRREIANERFSKSKSDDKGYYPSL